MKPPSPQPVPQEFFIFQTPLESVPTKRTQWFILAAQFPKTPEWYCAQLLASTVTESGLEVIPFANPLQPEIYQTPLILNYPPFFVHVLVFPTYG
jgi:hypothetical protein